MNRPTVDRASESWGHALSLSLSPAVLRERRPRTLETCTHTTRGRTGLMRMMPRLAAAAALYEIDTTHSRPGAATNVRAGPGQGRAAVHDPGLRFI